MGVSPNSSDACPAYVRVREVKEQQAEAKRKAKTRPTVITSILLYVGGIVSGVVVTILTICWFNSEAFKNYAAGWQSIATFFALFVGGWWTYSRFIRFRAGKPKIDLRVEVAFIREQASQWIITVEALFESKSKVRHEFEDLIFEIRYTLPTDELQNKKVDDETTLSVKFPYLAAKGSWLNDARQWSWFNSVGLLVIQKAAPQVAEISQNHRAHGSGYTHNCVFKRNGAEPGELGKDRVSG
jgi:hypothetical protein